MTLISLCRASRSNKIAVQELRSHNVVGMSFHLGRPVLVMILLALISGALILRAPDLKRADLRVWVFAQSHARSYREPDPQTGASLADLFQARTGQRVAVDLIHARALDLRLISLFMNDTVGMEVPDLAEVEIGNVGKFFRPPVEEVGFLPLNELLERDGLMETVVRERFAPWTKDGVIFGVPHDVHPVGLTYRKDLFEEAGIDLSAVQTWEEFHEKGLAFVKYWRERGVYNRWAIELPFASADYLTLMLMQRGINVLDDHNNVYLNDPRVTETIVFYVGMIAGPRRIAGEATPGGLLWTRDIAHGYLCSVITPDWRLSYIRDHAPEAGGKVRLMPLPRFDPTDARTGTWGGTMIGIPRRAADPEASWELLKFLYFSEEGLAARQRVTMILPPVRSHWSSPVYHQPDPFFGGQKVDALFIDLADEIPPRYVTPFTSFGTQSLATVLNRARSYMEQYGSDGLAEHVQQWLDEEAEFLRRRVAFGEFDE